MLGIDPRIIEYEIKMYENEKCVWQNLQPVNPRKAIAIKAKVEKLLKSGFIYLVPLIEWVSNPVLIRNRGSFVYAWIYVIRTSPVWKTTIQLPLSIRLLMNAPKVKYFHSWMDFPTITRSKSDPRINIKPCSFFLGALLLIENFLLALKMLGPPSNGLYVIFLSWHQTRCQDIPRWFVYMLLQEGRSSHTPSYSVW